MRRPAPFALALLAAAALPHLAAAQENPVPVGLTANFSIAGGGELGLPAGEQAGLAELEGTIGFEFELTGIRPELGLALGLAPDTSLALRPGLRWTLPSVPVQLRAALDASSARGGGLHWRWLLLGAATELRFTSVLALFAEVDSGAPLKSSAGVPLLFRAGATFRF